jgi:hypothetical protein
MSDNVKKSPADNLIQRLAHEAVRPVRIHDSGCSYYLPNFTTAARYMVHVYRGLVTTRSIADDFALRYSCPEYMLYYFTLMWYWILKQMELTGNIEQSQLNFVKMFENNHKPDTLPIDGFMIMFFQALTRVKPSQCTLHYYVLPYLPPIGDCNLVADRHFVFDKELAVRMPDIDGLFRARYQIEFGFPTCQEATTYDWFNDLWSQTKSVNPINGIGNMITPNRRIAYTTLTVGTRMRLPHPPDWEKYKQDVTRTRFPPYSNTDPITSELQLFRMDKMQQWMRNSKVRILDLVNKIPGSCSQRTAFK